MSHFKHLKFLVGGMVVIFWLLSLAILSDYIPMNSLAFIIAAANTVICWFFLENLTRLASDIKTLRGKETDWDDIQTLIDDYRDESTSASDASWTTAPDTCFEDFNNAEEHSK